jgi:hypothetical protein
VLNRNDHHTLDAKDHDGSMSHLGQKAKYSLRADVFRYSPDIRHSARASGHAEGVPTASPIQLRKAAPLGSAKSTAGKISMIGLRSRALAIGRTDADLLELLTDAPAR